MGTPNFMRLGLRERWRVIAAVRRGRTPRDPGLAIATVEFAHVSQSQRQQVALYWAGAILVVAIYAVVLIPTIVAGEVVITAMFSVGLAVTIACIALQPFFWPARARAAEAAARALVE